MVVLVVFGVSLLIATYCTYAERVIAAFLINPQIIADLPESTVRELEQNPPLKLGGPNGTSF